MKVAELLSHLPDEIACEYLTDALFLSGPDWTSKVEHINIRTLDGCVTVTRAEVEAELLRLRPPI